MYEYVNPVRGITRVEDRICSLSSCLTLSQPKLKKRVRGLGGIVRCILVIKIVLRVFGSYRYLREEE